jgi:peptidoglycan/xylan/chitin deacetylase (PgdA/CDA1 family)
MNNHKFALPLLQKYAVPFTLSLIVKNTDEFSLDPSTSIDYAHMTWEQVLEMAAGGAEVLNHSYNLHGWGRGRTGCAQKYGESAETYRAALTEDLLRAQARIFEMTDRVPRAFAYPYGKYNDCANGVLRQLGFLATLTCDYGVNVLKKGDPDCLFNLKRICRAHGESAEKIINEAMKTLR